MSILLGFCQDVTLRTSAKERVADEIPMDDACGVKIFETTLWICEPHEIEYERNNRRGSDTRNIGQIASQKGETREADGD